jgi:hypothetical protein
MTQDSMHAVTVVTKLPHFVIKPRVDLRVENMELAGSEVRDFA